MKPFEKGRWQKCWNGEDAGTLLIEGNKTNKRNATATHTLGHAEDFPDRVGAAQRWTRGSHATETGAPHRRIYSRPARKVQEGGHACFCFHSPGTCTRPYMWVLNICPNTRSNIEWAESEKEREREREREWGGGVVASLRKELEQERGQRGTRGRRK